MLSIKSKAQWLYVILCVVITLSACQSQQSLDDQLQQVITEHDLQGQPRSKIAIPDINTPLSQLGKKLFFSTSLSGNGDVACVSCHHPQLGGGDDLSLPIGIDAVMPTLLGPGRKLDKQKVASHSHSQDDGPNVPRNSPSTFNSGYYQKALFWDGRVRMELDAAGESYDGGGIVTPDSFFATTDPQARQDLLFAQSRFPVTSGQEMLGFAKNHFHNDEVRESVENNLRQESVWLDEFKQVFQQPKAGANELITFANVSEALAAYQRSQNFISNPWQDYITGKLSALDEQQKQGALLFYQVKQGAGQSCASCHSGDFFSDEAYYNLAIPQFGHGKDKLKNDYGRKRVTRASDDKFRFRTPTLLNVTATGPYGHDGAYDDLYAMLNHHVNPEQAIQDYDYKLQHLAQYKEQPVEHPYIRKNTEYALQAAKKTGDLPQLNYTAQELEDIAAFLEALTDRCVEDAECLAPWLLDGTEPQTMQLLQAQLKGEPGVQDENTVNLSPLFIEQAKLAGIQHRFIPSRPDLPLDAKPNDPKLTRLITSNMHLTMTGGVATGDVNGDGLPDVFLVGGDLGESKLYINQGHGKFSDGTAQSGIDVTGLMSNGATFADVDGDGLDDLLIGGAVKRSSLNIDGGGQTPAPYSLWRNLGHGEFENMTKASGLIFNRNSFSSAFADYDQDGDLDLAVGHWHRMMTNQEEEVHLWENQGKGVFKAANHKMQVNGSWSGIDWSFTPTFADINNDGWVDLLYTSDFETTQYFINEQGKRFVNATSPNVITDENGMGSAVADYDNDGDLDWFVTGVYDVKPKMIANNLSMWGGSGNRLYRNKGDGSFEDATEEVGVRDGGWGWASCFADFNNDGHLDILHVNGYLYDDHPAWIDMAGLFTHQAPRLFMNDGNGRYADRALELGLTEDEGRTISCTDFDRDGDVDLLVQQLAKPTLLYMNQSVEQGQKNFVGVKIKGPAGNPHMAGARVYVTTGGKTQMREIKIGSNYLSQNAAEAHFGLGDVDVVDELKVVLPKPFAKTLVKKDVQAGEWVVLEL